MDFRRQIGGLLAGLTCVAVLAAIPGCGGDSETTVTETRTEAQAATGATSEVEVAQANLEQIIERDRDDPDYHVEGIKADPLIAPAFVSGVKVATQQAKQQGATGLDFDPILCAQNLPKSVTYEPGARRDSQLVITGVFEYGAGEPVRVTYHMVNDGETWKLNGTDCLEQAVGGQP